jgi:hypothetical protein
MYTQNACFCGVSFHSYENGQVHLSYMISLHKKRKNVTPTPVTEDFTISGLDNNEDMDLLLLDSVLWKPNFQLLNFYGTKYFMSQTAVL